MKKDKVIKSVCCIACTSLVIVSSVYIAKKGNLKKEDDSSVADVEATEELEIGIDEVERYNLADSPESLKSRNDLIVVGEVGHTENRIPDRERGESFGEYTATSFSVKEVIKGDVLPGDVITVDELYYVQDGQVWLYDSYVPMQKGTTYMLFLKLEDDEGEYYGQYALVDYEYDRMVCDADIDLDALDTDDRDVLQLGERTDMEKYLSWYKAIMTEYRQTGTLAWTLTEEDEAVLAASYYDPDEVVREAEEEAELEATTDGYLPFVETVTEGGYQLEAGSDIPDASNYERILYSFTLLSGTEEIGTLQFFAKQDTVQELESATGVFLSSGITQEDLLLVDGVLYLPEDWFAEL